MKVYKFPDIYPTSISYSHGFSIFAFFGKPEQTKEFFKYLYYRINQDEKERKKGNNICCHVIRNDNDREPLIDINYNFFIEVLSDWVANYSLSKNDIVNYRAYGKFAQTKDGNTQQVTKYRDCSLDMTTKEKVLADYSYSLGRVNRDYYKRLRYNLIQLLFNNILGKHTYVSGYQYRNRAKTTTVILVKDNQFDYYVKLPIISFVRSTLAKYLNATQMKRLHEISDGYEVIGRQTKGIYKKIKELNIDEKEIRYCNLFDLAKIENERNILDGKWTLFKADDKVILDESDDDIPEFDD